MGRRFIDVDVAAAAAASVEVDARARGVVRGRFFDDTRCLELGSRSGGGSTSISMPMKALPVSALPRFIVHCSWLMVGTWYRLELEVGSIIASGKICEKGEDLWLKWREEISDLEVTSALVLTFYHHISALFTHDMLLYICVLLLLLSSLCK